MSTGKTPRVYLDTNVWNFQFADDAEEKKQATRQFFAEAREGHFELFSSDVVVRELSATVEQSRRSLLLQFFAEVAPAVLDVSEDALVLGQQYIRVGAVPARFANDALHLAIATVEDLDIVLSWNMRHMVKRKTRRSVNAANQLAGYDELEISTPAEVTTDDD